MEAQTIRVFWPRQTTGWKNFNWDGVITAESVVHISACEYHMVRDASSGAEGPIRARGDAPIWVKNVHPHGPNFGDTITGGVEFYLQVDWGTLLSDPLDVALDITVIGVPSQRQVIR